MTTRELTAEQLRERTRLIIKGVEARGFIRFEYGLILWVREVGGVPVRLPTRLLLQRSAGAIDSLDIAIEWWADETSVKAALALRALCGSKDGLG